MRRPFLLLISLLSALSASGQDKKPSVIVIMTDDMGFSDLGCYGGEIATPNLDALAANGVRFTQFYNTARCCPTRAALLTGQYPHRAGIGHMMEDKGSPGYRGDLNREVITFAEATRPAGYTTIATGKWHVTPFVHPRNEAEKANWPLQRGFDMYYGTISGAGNFFDPAGLVRGNTPISAFADPDYKPEEPFYYTDAITDNAVRFVKQTHQDDPEKPLLMYVAYTAAHWPMQARESDIASQHGKYTAGYEAIRQERLRRVKEKGLLEQPDITLPPVKEGLENTPDWAWDQRNMEVYAAMIECMDRGVGRIVDSLKETGRFENTLILFLQDNGACAETVGRDGKGGPRADKPSLPVIAPDVVRQKGVRTVTRDGYPVRTGRGSMAGPEDTFIAYGQAWATVSNTPFREFKHWVHEGGISTPLIMHWPAAVAGEMKGKLYREPAHLIDVMPTILALSGAPYPATFNGREIAALPGVSLIPALEGKPLNRQKPLFWEHEGNRAVRDGNWKLVAKSDKPWELYDISKDRGETENLAAAEPERVQTMSGQWDTFAKENYVLRTNVEKKEADPVASTEKEFKLSAGDSLEGKDSPDMTASTLRIEAEIIVAPDTEGVIVSQGGSRQGWALFVRNEKIALSVRIDGKISTIDLPIADGNRTIIAEINANGQFSLAVQSGEISAQFDTETALKQPSEGLTVGSDPKGKVGPYENNFPYSSEIGKIHILIQPQEKSSDP